MRIVSLCPSTTETLIDFGLEESLVGVTKFCIHPQAAVARIEKVGGTKNPRVERILELKPDLVLVNEEENRREDHERLAQALRVEVSFPKTLAEVPEHLRWLGELVNRPSQAEHRAIELETAIDHIVAARAMHPGSSFRFAYLIWRNPWMAAGPDTYVDDLIRRAGGENIFQDQSVRYPSFELSDLDALGAETILLPDEPFPFRTRHIPEVQEACPSARVETISGDDCCWHGVRSIRGAQLALTLFRKWALPGTPDPVEL